MARAAVELLGCNPKLEIVTGWAVIPAEVRGTEVSLVLPPIEDAPRSTGIRSPVAVGEIQRLVVGVPHLVARVNGLAELDLEVVAAPLRSHFAAGPEGANVNLYQIEDDGVAIRTWERGVEAETLSCGSGSVAVALVVMTERGRLANVVQPASGDLLSVEALGEPPCARPGSRGRRGSWPRSALRRVSRPILSSFCRCSDRTVFGRSGQPGLHSVLPERSHSSHCLPGGGRLTGIVVPQTMR